MEMEGLLLEQRHICVFYLLLCQKTMKVAFRRVGGTWDLESLGKSQRFRRKVLGVTLENKSTASELGKDTV